MNVNELRELVENKTGAVFFGEMIPASFDMSEFGLNVVDKFFTNLFSAESQFDDDGNLDPASAANILSLLEQVSIQANQVMVDIISRMGTMSPHFHEEHPQTMRGD